MASILKEIAHLKRQRDLAGAPKVSAKPDVAETKTYTTRVKEAVMSKLTATGVVVMYRLEINIGDTTLVLSHRDYFMMPIQAQQRQFLSGAIDRMVLENP